MLPQEFIDQHKRERALRALAKVVSEVGPGELTVALVVSEGKMARSTFYDLFDSADDAFRAAIELGGRKLTLAIDDAAGREGPWPRRIGNVISALVAAAAEEPDLARLSLVHGCSGPAASGPFDPAVVTALAGVLRPARQAYGGAGPSPRTEELVAYGVLAVIAERLRRGEPTALDQELADELTELAVRPFLAALDHPAPNWL